MMSTDELHPIPCTGFSALELPAEPFGNALPVTFPSHPFTWPMARDLGISRHLLERALTDGELARPFRNVYVRADRELTVEQRAAAAGLVTSPWSVVCDRSAAWIWDVDCFAFRELDTPPHLETRTLRGHRATARPQMRSGQRDLWPTDWVVVGGTRVTTPLRTALDLGCGLNRRDALAAMDALARGHGFTSADLRRSSVRYVRRRGVVQLRELVALVDARAESSGESWTRLEMHDHGLPAPKVNWWVVVDGVPTYRLDLAYPHARVAVEYDGEEFHSGDVHRRADRARRSWLERHGWTVFVVDKTMFTPDAVAEWIGRVRDALQVAQTPPRRWYVHQ